MLAVPLTDYYEEVRRYLTCPEEVKDDLIYDVNRKVMDLNADRPDLDYDDVVDFLGEPENLAQSLSEKISFKNSCSNYFLYCLVSPLCLYVLRQRKQSLFH